MRCTLRSNGSVFLCGSFSVSLSLCVCMCVCVCVCVCVCSPSLSLCFSFMSAASAAGRSLSLPLPPVHPLLAFPLSLPLSLSLSSTLPSSPRAHLGIPSSDGEEARVWLGGARAQPQPARLFANVLAVHPDAAHFSLGSQGSGGCRGWSPAAIWREREREREGEGEGEGAGGGQTQGGRGNSTTLPIERHKSTSHKANCRKCASSPGGDDAVSVPHRPALRPGWNEL